MQLTRVTAPHCAASRLTLAFSDQFYLNTSESLHIGAAMMLESVLDCVELQMTEKKLGRASKTIAGEAEAVVYMLVG